MRGRAGRRRTLDRHDAAGRCLDSVPSPCMAMYAALLRIKEEWLHSCIEGLCLGGRQEPPLQLPNQKGLQSTGTLKGWRTKTPSVLHEGSGGEMN